MGRAQRIKSRYAKHLRLHVYHVDYMRSADMLHVSVNTNAYKFFHPGLNMGNMSITVFAKNSFDALYDAFMAFKGNDPNFNPIKIYT